VREATTGLVDDLIARGANSTTYQFFNNLLAIKESDPCLAEFRFLDNCGVFETRERYEVSGEVSAWFGHFLNLAPFGIESSDEFVYLIASDRLGCCFAFCTKMTVWFQAVLAQ